MDFKPNYPIYLQVADFICENVLTRAWLDGDKLPSVKELSVTTSVNPNTVIKALAYLQDNSVLITQRGIGYFLTDVAYQQTLTLKRRQFIEEDVPALFANMKLLGVSLEQLISLYEQKGFHDETE
jgi:DNA-binding transcriptional regulator YhcF (GntR family)